MPVGGLRPGAQVSDGSDSEYGSPIVQYVYCLSKSFFFSSGPDDKGAKMRRAVHANNCAADQCARRGQAHVRTGYSPSPRFLFTKLRSTRVYRMAYIEENVKRRGHQQQLALDADAGTSMGTDKEPTTTTIANTTAGSNPVGNTKDDDPFDHVDPRYNVERKLGEEGSITNSLTMLTTIPEVDLGMECVSQLHPYPLLFFPDN